MSDPYHLQRFIDAQDSVYEQVCSELRGGRKSSHWMWFVFPQIEGLGHSFMAKQYAISSLDEAAAYLRHPVLGPRLVECAELVVRVEGRTIRQIFGSPDDLKFRSSMTLFAAVSPDTPIFQQALDKYFDGDPDELTRVRLRHLAHDHDCA
jgi:uncharacterized protein (DUF1810 family)